MHKYYRCERCGRIVEIIKEGEGELICHGAPMKEIEEKEVNLYLQEFEDISEIRAVPEEGFKNVEDILNFAIKVEEDSYNFYKYWEEKLEHPYMKKIFGIFASEELKHKKKIQEIKAGNKLKLSESADKKIMDLKIANYLVDVKPTSEMDFQDALILAMKREKAAYEFYDSIKELVDSPEMKQVFEFLANEEARHKLKLETIYDEHIYKNF